MILFHIHFYHILILYLFLYIEYYIYQIIQSNIYIIKIQSLIYLYSSIFSLLSLFCYFYKLENHNSILSLFIVADGNTVAYPISLPVSA